MKHINIKIFGKVQGVFFRHFTKLKAKELGITGFVRNEPDGTVYIEAESDERILEQFLEWCKHGLKFVEVERTESFSGKIKGFLSFVIK